MCCFLLNIELLTWVPKPSLSLQLSFGSLTLIESDFGVFMCAGKLKVCNQCSAGISFSE